MRKMTRCERCGRLFERVYRPVVKFESHILVIKSKAYDVDNLCRKCREIK